MNGRPLPDPAPGLDLDESAMRALTERVVDWTVRQVASVAQEPSWDHQGARELELSLREDLPEHGAPIGELLEVLSRAVPKSFNTAGPGYLAYVPGGGLYPAALADYLALAVNRYVGVYAAAPALVRLELNAVDWLRELIGLPQGWFGILTSGGSLSGWIAMVTARRAWLEDDFADAVVYVSREGHHSVAKAAVLAGFDARHVRAVAIDARRRMDPAALDAAIRADRAAGLRPAVLVASMGTTNTGALDPLPELAQQARAHGLWLHVDAAYGGFFRALPEMRPALAGLELADSVTLDPHKGLFLPYGTGCLLVRERAHLERTFGSGADYLQDLEAPPGAVDYARVSPELSRDFRGLRVWTCLKLFGAEAFRANLREKLELARWAAQELARQPELEVDPEPQLSVVAFRARGPRSQQRSRAILQRVNAGRRVFLSSTLLDGRFTLRICVLSFRTHAADVRAAVEEVRRALSETEGAET